MSIPGRNFCFQGFVDGSCQYIGSTLENVQEITSPTGCQQACKDHSQCNYFYYNGNDCLLLDSGYSICDKLRGPRRPPITECEGIYLG